MPLQWNESLATNVVEIDNQHRELITSINNLLQAMQQRKGNEEIEAVLRFLDEYVKMHFGMEEEYMQKHTYPGYNSHKEEHDQFIKSFLDLKQEFGVVGPEPVMVIKTQRWLTDWWTSHIGKVDKELGAFLQSKLG